MLHAHNFTTYIKKEITEYLILILLTLIASIAVFRLFPYGIAAFFNSLVFLGFIIILFFKSGLRRIFYFHIYSESEYKQTESITSVFIFSLLFSLIVFILLFFGGLLLRIYKFPEFYQSATVYFSIYVCFILPTLMTEMTFISGRNSNLFAIFRYSTVVMFISGLVFPLIYHPDLILILQFFALTSIIRFFIFIVLLFDFQMIDFFSLTLKRFRKYLSSFLESISNDILYWLMTPVLYFVVYFQLEPEFQVIWSISFLIYIAIQLTISEAIEQWNLIFKNFMRLDLTNEYVSYAKHIMVWQSVLFFASVPFFILISIPLFGWMMTDIPDTVSTQIMMVCMVLISLTGYFISNPMKELIIYFGRKKEILSITLSSIAGVIISSIFFNNLIGFWGMYFAMMLGGFIYWIGINVVIQQLLGCEFKYLFPYKVMAKIFLSGLLATASAYSVSLIPNIIFKETGWMVFVFYTTYTLMIIFFRVLKNENGVGFVNWTMRLGNLR